MGTFKVEAEVWNPKRPKARARVELLVDTDATYTTMSSTVLEALEVKPLRMVKLKLADGTVIEKPLGEVGIEVEGYRASATPVVFGNEGIFLLGSVTMEQLGLVPDPVSKRLKPTEALLMGLPMSGHVKEHANALSQFTARNELIGDEVTVKYDEQVCGYGDGAWPCFGGERSRL
jgi:predicted aspartyl protease